MEKIVNPNDTKAARNIESVLSLCEGMINDKLAAESIPQYVAPDYIQHNPIVPDGAEGLTAVFSAINTIPLSRVKVQRVIAVDDWVYAHVHFINLDNNEPDDLGSAAVDIYRFNEAGNAVEHWDVIQPIVDPATAANTNGQL